ncbi:hypothetical protein E4K66_05355 [Bradyrhizobium frederickii]|uniref:PEGA domain-containing protein n=2 Tax=Bradyrhizobium frederickii TaxID=2560054 RepID=A0A4Y9LH80_9BRAD|nr:hypothetical protein E4K66_05355 [Bradyrhizobium frederickii]
MAVRRSRSGWFMRRVIAIALAGANLLGAASLGGCSSMSFDVFKSTPPTVQVRLESNPPGADATTSLGPGCKTPCSVSVPAPDVPFTVAFALPKYQPASVPVNLIRNPGDFTTPASVTTDPDPVFAELQPATPPRPVRKPHRPRKPKPAAAAPAAAPVQAIPAAASPFPDPNAGRR